MRTAQPRSRTRLIVGGGFALIVAAAVAAAGLYYLFGRSTPAAVSLTTATSSAAATTASPSIEASSTAEASATADGSSTGSGGGDLSGTWEVDASVGSFSDFSGSFVGYRVQEELASVGAAIAVGRTPDVSGTLVLDGTTITSVSIEADLSTLQSDNEMRDGQLQRQALETARYPTATFVLTKPIELDSLPADGDTISVTATGDLTIHGVTKSVQIPLEAKLSEGVVSVVGSTTIKFADYGMSSPQSMMVLSIADEGVMELQLQLTKA
jgi:polyisoprenoid-binding protein YceI